MGFTRWGLCFVLAVLALTMQFSAGFTNPQDVMAINDLHLSLGLPPLLGWLPYGGDPCGEEWLGVVCDSSNITEIRLSGMNLGGYLSDTLADFVSIRVMNLSDNYIGGSIPDTLPSTITNFSLAGNQLIGNIPIAFSFLSHLLVLSLNSNRLTGEIPDVFQELTKLINLDMSGNNLTGQLPPSMANLSSLNTLHLQNNKLIGTLDVIKDLPLADLDLENNLFSGPIPEKLLKIPNFRKDGNPFNTTIITFPPTAALPPSLAWPPSSDNKPWNPSANAPSASKTHISARTRKFWTTQRMVAIAVSVSVVLVGLVMCIALWRRHKSRQLNVQSNILITEECKDPKPASKMEKVPREAMIKPLNGYGVDSRDTAPDMTSASLNYKSGHKMEMAGQDMANLKLLQQPLPPPPRFFTSDEAAKKITCHPSSLNSSSSVSVFSIASLQQFTNSFSEENLIGEGFLGNVYKADLPDGKLLAVKKLNITPKSDEEFLDLVLYISKLRHNNILELLGYCNEHAQRLLMYEYCPNGSLYDALHMENDMHKKLTWTVRIRVALGASRALQYLHEVCRPLVVHQNFKSSNVLLDENLTVCLADCGLAHLLPPGSTNQVSGYAAPETETGSYTCQSDVYSLGVVMLELLTGRKSYDRTRPRGEQSLARWAIPQLHDIDALSSMVDPSLNGAYPVKSLSRFADIIFRCVQMEPGFRPPVSEIIQDLLRMV